MEHTSKNPRLAQLEMALLNATSALGDLVAAIRAGKSVDRESDPSLPSTMGRISKLPRPDTRRH